MKTEGWRDGEVVGVVLGWEVEAEDNAIVGPMVCIGGIVGAAGFRVKSGAWNTKVS